MVWKREIGKSTVRLCIHRFCLVENCSHYLKAFFLVCFQVHPLYCNETTEACFSILPHGHWKQSGSTSPSHRQYGEESVMKHMLFFPNVNWEVTQPLFLTFHCPTWVTWTHSTSNVMKVQWHDRTDMKYLCENVHLLLNTKM